MFVDISHNNNDKSQKSSKIFCVKQKPWKSWKIWYSHFFTCSFFFEKSFFFLTKIVFLIRVFISFFFSLFSFFLFFLLLFVLPDTTNGENRRQNSTVGLTICLCEKSFGPRSEKSPKGFDCEKQKDQRGKRVQAAAVPIGAVVCPTPIALVSFYLFSFDLRRRRRGSVSTMTPHQCWNA